MRAGQPLLDTSIKIVRVARLGGESGGITTTGDEFELKRAVRDLFRDLARLEDGMVLRLEFKRGLPCLLETLQSVGSEITLVR